MIFTLPVFVYMIYAASVGAVVYLPTPDFIESIFPETPAVKSIWIKAEENEVAKEILGHSYPALRVRYWQEGRTTAWVMDEIGKERPITIGVVISDDKIQKVTILAFRESRGGEVRHPFFTRQFIDQTLDDNLRLQRKIDGISGATLSVRAVERVSRYALYLHSLVIE